MTERSLEYYIESGEMPDNDPELLAALYKQASGEVSEEPANDDPPKQDEAAKAESVTSDADESKTDVEPEGIATKDGKHVLPYDVLKQEREKAQELKRLLEEQQREIEALKNAPQRQTLAEFTGMSDQELAELQEYFPEQFDKLNGALAAAQQLQSKVQQLEADKIRQEQEAARQRAASIQELIDANPVLSRLQGDPAKWAMCVSIDNTLQADPDNASLSMAERFEKVAKAASQLYGIQVEEPKPEPEKRAERKAAVKPPINSLSDLPGGSAPEASEAQKLENMSAVDIGAMFAKMTPAQQEAYLSKI